LRKRRGREVGEMQSGTLREAKMSDIMVRACR
jgi:hypothetical protein